MAEVLVLVFAFPLWNLTIPSALQAFLHYSIQSSFTFKYPAEGKKEFLLGDKKVYLLNVRSGFYNKPKMNALDKFPIFCTTLFLEEI